MKADTVAGHIRTLQNLVGGKKAAEDAATKGELESVSYECGYLRGVADCYNVDILRLIREVKSR
jgi:hypothetical protein